MGDGKANLHPLFLQGSATVLYIGVINELVPGCVMYHEVLLRCVDKCVPALDWECVGSVCTHLGGFRSGHAVLHLHSFDHTDLLPFSNLQHPGREGASVREASWAIQCYANTVTVWDPEQNEADGT